MLRFIDLDRRKTNPAAKVRSTATFTPVSYTHLDVYKRQGRIYAVNQQGQLLSYGDNGTFGNVSDPVVIGEGD